MDIRNILGLSDEAPMIYGYYKLVVSFNLFKETWTVTKAGYINRSSGPNYFVWSILKTIILEFPR